MRVLYLFNNIRHGAIERITRGDDHADHFFGMLRLSKYNIEADYAEIEQYFPSWLTVILRKFVNIYYIHLFLFWKFFSYDIVFTSSAFGSQLVHTMLHLKRPKWVMYDFSITGLIGEGKTARQKVFRWMTGRAAGIITLSTKEAEVLKGYFPNLKTKIEFIPFGVDLSFFKPQQGIQEENQIFTVGLAPDRDYRTFFEATKDLGVPVVATSSRTIDSFTSIPPYVQTKFFSPRELVEEYTRSRVFVLPLDITKGTNNAMGCSTLVEAMAMGKAIIVTRTPTTESYITHGVNGLLVEPNDVVGLRRAIQNLLGDGQKRSELGKEARLFVGKNCDAEAVAKRMGDFFKKISK